MRDPYKLTEAEKRLLEKANAERARRRLAIPADPGHPTVTRTAAGAATGGLMFGPIGAIVGAVVGHSSRKRAK